MKQALSYDDVLVVPQHSDIKSRQEIDIGITLGVEYDLALPIFSSPMDTVTWVDMAIAIEHAGGLGILHRYCTIEEQVDAYKQCSKSNAYPGCAIGATGDYKERVRALRSEGCLLFCVDVAHGHHTNVAEVIQFLTSIDVYIMAGNVATAEGYWFLANAGVDIVRVGIGGGSICSTRIQTGHGMPTLQSLLDIKSSRTTINHWNDPEPFETRLKPGPVIIADGGIKTSGDIVKAFAAGADLVMLGSLLAGTDEAPGHKIETGQGVMKEYRGMASADAQNAWRGYVGSEEGVAALVPYKGSVGNILKSLAKGIRSGLSYSGARTISEFQKKAQLIQQTSAGQFESSTHIYARS